MRFDNPAARLLIILEQGIKFPGTTKCGAVWKDILGAENMQDMLPKMAKVMALSAEAVDELSLHFPDQLDVFMGWKKQIDNAFYAQQLNSHWSTFRDNITDHTVGYLKMSALLLDGKSKTQILDDKVLTELKLKIETIYQEVIQSNINEDIKIYLIKFIRKLLNNFDEYAITGAFPFLESTDTILGHALLHPEYKDFLNESKLGKDLLGALSVLADLVSLGTGLPQISTIKTFLLNNFDVAA